MNSSGSNAEVAEVWVTFILYLILAGINSIVQYLTREQLNQWYLHDGRIKDFPEENGWVADLDQIRFYNGIEEAWDSMFDM